MGDVVSVVRANNPISRSKYQLTGTLPIVDQGQGAIAGWTDDNSTQLPLGSYVLFGDHTRSVKYVDFHFAQGADGLQILKTKDGVLPRYFFHILSAADLPNRGYNRHWSVVREIAIPIPPIEEQIPIVEILDQFDTLVNDISIGLPAEINARRQQYEYYRDKLLAFKELQAS